MHRQVVVDLHVSMDVAIVVRDQIRFVDLVSRYLAKMKLLIQ